MGCSFTKKRQEILESNPETFDVPLLARSEWENILLTNDLSMDQDNFDLAKERFEERERIHDQNESAFKKMKTNTEEQMSARKNDMDLEHILFRQECSRFKLREKNFKDKEETLKEKENSFEAKKACGEEVMLQRLTSLKSAEFVQMEESAISQYITEEENGFVENRSAAQGEMLAGEESVILGLEKQAHQNKEMALAFFKEREMWKTENTILLMKVKECQQRETCWKNKERFV